MKILDCTLRDGGYYNKWDFSDSVVRAYLESVAKANIDVVELGFRNFPQNDFIGAYGYTTESYLSRLELPEGPKYGVMIDAKTILNSGMPIKDAVNTLFIEEGKSKVSLVRIASHLHEIEQSTLIADALKEKGYTVGLNLMQAGGKPGMEIEYVGRMAADCAALDVLYFADSLGNMDSSEVIRLVTELRKCWKGELGIHTHNNMGRALDNSITAFDAGVTWLDSTVTGMGRGAGNAATETLLTLLSKSNSRYNPSPIYELVIRHFEPLQKEFGWGTNLLYFIGAQHNVHPTYIQNLMSDRHYGTDEIIGAIEYLSKLETSSSFSAEVYETAVSFSNSEKPVSGSPCLIDIAKNKEILLIANGPNLHKYINDIEAYIRDKKPVVVALNALSVLSDVIDYYCISRNSKFLSDRNKYKNLGKPIILPAHRFGEDELDLLSSTNDLIDYGFLIEKDIFEVFDNYCCAPFEMTAAYAFAVAQIMGSGKISLVGFDGYESHDQRQVEMVEIFSRLRASGQIDKFQSLTPTNYDVSRGSIYAPS